MKLRTKYLVFVGILHLVALGLSFYIFRKNIVLFLISEVFILVSIIIAWRLYNELIRPLKLLMQGADAISDRDFNVKFLPTGSFEMDRLISVYNGMMDELRKERTLQEQQHLFLEKLIQSSPTGIIILDYDRNVRLVNPRALRLLEMEEGMILRKPVNELQHPVLQQIGSLQTGHSRTITLNGAVTFKLQKSHFIDRGFPREFVLIEELTSEILEAEKKTYEKVIRMMAHEVNNTIGPVNSILQFTLQSQYNSEALVQALNAAMERNNNLNAFMRNFADLVRLPEPQKKPVDLIALLRNTTELMQLRSGEKQVRFILQLHSERMMVRLDITQMEQALINIVKNAIEAIEGIGTIEMITLAHPVQLIIRDSGAGISSEQESKLFSPFYSTKKDGQGVGLILVRDILLNHGFTFSLRTITPGCTEFSITFE